MEYHYAIRFITIYKKEVKKMDNDIQESFINIAGNPTKVFFDIQAMMDSEQTLKMMMAGMYGRDFISLSEPPYDMREVVTLLMQGIRGANREDNISKTVDFSDAQKLFDKHLAYLGKTYPTIEERKAGYEQLKKELSEACKRGLHFFIEPTA